MRLGNRKRHQAHPHQAIASKLAPLRTEAVSTKLQPPHVRCQAWWQAETKMNRHSSRSHAVFIVTVVNRATPLKCAFRQWQSLTKAQVDQSRQKFGQLYLATRQEALRSIKPEQSLSRWTLQAPSVSSRPASQGRIWWRLSRSSPSPEFAGMLQVVPFRSRQGAGLL